MKNSLAVFFMLMSMCFNAGLACADVPPVLVMHELTSSSKGETTTTLSFIVHVENPGDAAIYYLALSLVPETLFLPGQALLDVATLGPGQSVDIPLQVTAPGSLNVEEISPRPLFWVGKCIDDLGTMVDFTVTSLPGGVQ